MLDLPSLKELSSITTVRKASREIAAIIAYRGLIISDRRSECHGYVVRPLREQPGRTGPLYDTAFSIFRI